MATSPGRDDAVGFVRAYYDGLRAGEPLAPFFADGPDVVKFGLSEHLDGGDAVAEGLREQTRTTTDWSVESHDLRVTEREDHAWMADLVSMGWTDTERGIRFEFDTRWSATLERQSAVDGAADGTNAEAPDDEGHWRFVAMHVSTAEGL